VVTRPDPFPVGARIAERFVLESVLGRGGTGVVYRAIQEPIGRAIAIKILRSELSLDAGARARFEREARVASSLDHPSALAIHDFGEHDGHAFLAMELVDAPTLRAVLDPSPDGLGAARAIDLAFSIADVLAAAHRVDLVHRDLKPENVFVLDEGVRVADFGLAFRERDPAAGRMTREGVVVGTPGYCSPEQARGDRVGAPTDVYALGCVLHELVTGRALFAGTEMEILTKQMYAPPPPLRGAEVPESLAALRTAMLDKRAEARPSMGEVRDRLAAIDPDPDRGRARARVDGYLGARASRMVEPAPAPVGVRREHELAVCGAIESELIVALAAAGIVAFAIEEGETLAGVSAIYAAGASIEEIARLAKSGVPVIADADPGDVARLTGLMRAGAADVAPRPVIAAELARRIARVGRR
jgi:serine/threonine-protein kinase